MTLINAKILSVADIVCSFHLYIYPFLNKSLHKQTYRNLSVSLRTGILKITEFE